MFKKPLGKEIARLLAETLQPEIDRRDIAPDLPVFDERRGGNSIAGAGASSAGACRYTADFMIERRPPRRLEPARDPRAMGAAARARQPLAVAADAVDHAPPGLDHRARTTHRHNLLFLPHIGSRTRRIPRLPRPCPGASSKRPGPVPPHLRLRLGDHGKRVLARRANQPLPDQYRGIGKPDGVAGQGTRLHLAGRAPGKFRGDAYRRSRFAGNGAAADASPQHQGDRLAGGIGSCPGRCGDRVGNAGCHAPGEERDPEPRRDRGNACGPRAG